MTDGQRWALIAGMLMFAFKVTVIFFWWRKEAMSKTQHAEGAPWPTDKPKPKRVIPKREYRPKMDEVDKRFAEWASRNGIDLASLPIMKPKSKEKKS